MSIVQPDKRELEVKVTLSAIGMTQIGIESGNFSFSSILPDAQNINALNLGKNVNNPEVVVGVGISETKITPRIKQLPFLNNAYSCRLLTNPSASACTFAYGGIDSNEFHKEFDLLVGPPTAEYSKYNSQYPNYVGAGITNLKKPFNNSGFKRVQDLEPFIPFISFDVQNLDDAKKNNINPFFPILKWVESQLYGTTYNIWNIGSVNDVNTSNKFYTNDATKYDGPIPSIGSTVAPNPYIKTIRDGLNGSYLRVESVNNGRTGMIKRIFPVSKDYLYEEPFILYPTRLSSPNPVNGSYIDYKDGIWFDLVDAKGSDNCGFYIKISDSSTRGPDSSILFILEDENKSKQINKINYLSIELKNNQKPIITTRYNIDSTKYSESKYSQVQSPVFNDTSDFEIFVHFAGPSLLVGFESDSTKWNVIQPEEVQNTKTNKVENIEFHFRKESTFIKAIVTNVAFTMKYSAIMFNNYHYPEVADINDENKLWRDRTIPADITWYDYNNSTGSKTYSLKTGGFISMPLSKNHVVFDFKTRLDKKDSVSEDAVIKSINDNIYMSSIFPSKYNQLGDKTVSAFLDWRNPLFRKEIFNDPPDYQDNPILIYAQIATSEGTKLYEKQNVVQNWGKILFNGTIEGPIFFGTSLQYEPIVKDIDFLFDIKNGDISSYVSAININCRTDNPNNSFVNRSAEITLSNLDSSFLGWRILELIEHNVVVVTVESGYNNDLKTYFQGVITNIRSTRTGSNSEIELSCEDLAKYLFENLYYEAVVPYSTLTFRNCIFGTMIASGFHEYYRVQNASNIGNLDLRLSPNGITNQDALVATIYDRILEKLNIFLSKLVKIPTEQNPTVGQGVFRWEPKVGFILDARYAPSNVDVLKFGGISLENKITSIPTNNNADPGWHGVLTGSYTINTSTAPLSAIVQTFGSTLLEGFYAERTDNQFEAEALSVDARNSVVNSLLNTNSTVGVPQGYIGFRKKVMDALDKNEIFSKEVLTFKHEQNKKVVRIPFHEISFSCYVTKPLIFHGTFVIEPFREAGQSDYKPTDKYIYESIAYNINKSSNLITATIKGIRQPWTIRELEMKNKS